MNNKLFTDKDILDMLQPETDLERALALAPDMQTGFLWGEPRYGHPEGKVLFHIVEIFDNINRISPPLTADERLQLRLITLLHDTFKYKEDKSEPRDWSKNHGMLARQFAEKYITDETILTVIELHDEAYYCWKLETQQSQTLIAEARLEWLLGRLGDGLQLFYLFFKCDTATGDKTQDPVKWFEKKFFLA